MRATIACTLGVVVLVSISACERKQQIPDAVFRQLAGGKALNEIETFGVAAMPPNRLLEIPSCDVMLNGRGPYRVLLDTGAGQSLLLSSTVAEEIGLESEGGGYVSGLGGNVGIGFGLVETLEVGGTRCRQVTTYVTDGGMSFVDLCDGVIGTGLFSDARVRLDFEVGELSVSPSSENEPAGVAVPVTIGEGAHLMAGVTLAGKQITALLDSGASRPVYSPDWLEANFPDHPHLPLPFFAFTIGTAVNPAQYATSADVVLAERRLADLPGVVLSEFDTLTGDVDGFDCDMIIGMSVFREMRSFTVDFPRECVWVEWLDG